MWMVEDAHAGTITAGKSHRGEIAEVVNVNLKGKRLYQLQKFLREEISRGGDYYRVRWLVLIEEEIRQAIANSQQDQTPTQ